MKYKTGIDAKNFEIMKDSFDLELKRRREKRVFKYLYIIENFAIHMHSLKLLPPRFLSS